MRHSDATRRITVLDVLYAEQADRNGERPMAEWVREHRDGLAEALGRYERSDRDETAKVIYLRAVLREYGHKETEQ
jgi:hypothetical protein